MPPKLISKATNIDRLLNASFQHVKKLFFFAYNATDDDSAGLRSNRKYFLPRAEIKIYNVLIDGRTFYDQPIIDLI